MTMEMPPEVLEIFCDEASDLLRVATSALNEVANGDAAARDKGWAELKRALHTLKGAAAAACQPQVEQAAHAVEDQLGDEGPERDRERLDLLFSALETIEAMLPGAATAAAASPNVVPTPARGPTLDQDTTGASSDGDSSGAATSAAAHAPSTGSEAVAQQWLRVPPRRVDQLEAQVGELVLTRLRYEEMNERLLALRSVLARELTRQRQLHKALGEARSFLPQEHWSRLRVLSQEVNGGLGDFQAKFSSLCRDAPLLQAQASLVSQTVEESIQELRLMPLRPFFERFSGTARDAARRTDKRLRFEVDADGAEIDRSILIVLNDALLHLVRNAIVHGLEPPAVRAAAGKPAEGRLRLAAKTAGTHVEIIVEDDGGGVDEQAVRAKATALGIAGADQAEVLDLLTHPGFSTRETADDLAGRGVGLDVCVHTLRNLDGSIELRTQPGRGTRFTLRVPIRASTSLGLVLEVDGRAFGLLLSAVERVLRPDPAEYREVEGRLTLALDGRCVSIVWLSDLLGLQRPVAAQRRPPVIVIEHGRRQLGLIVDEIPGQAAMVIRRLGRAFRRADLFVGGAVQSDQSIVPILSAAALFARAGRARSTTRDSLPTAQEPKRREIHALVVDDSITMRTLIRNILDAAGYHVTVAENGLAALAALSAMSRCDVVITDLQMPEMDGIELCAAIRARDMPYVPIVMVTSVAEDGERRKALSAGADAYVVKASFEQSAFLSRVDTLVRGPQEHHA